MNKATKAILALLVLAVVASGAWIFLGKSGAENPRVVIEVDGEIFADYDMDEVKGIVPISTPNGGENRVYVQSDLVFMDSANCPDQVCVYQGELEPPTIVPIVCMPNVVYVSILERSEIDWSRIREEIVPEELKNDYAAYQAGN